MKKLKQSQGFTIVELLVVVAIIGILALVAFSAYAGVTQKAARSRAQADVASLARATGVIAAHCGILPEDTFSGASAWKCTETGPAASWTSALTSKLTRDGVVIGPLFGVVPTPPEGWGASYVYTWGGGTAPGSFTVAASGPGGVGISAP